MWSYYGSKANLAKYYPVPKYGKIIEPFAGAAFYSLKYFDRDVTLVDKYDVVIKIWKWLQKCSESDILGLPRPKEGDRVGDMGLCEEASWLMGFLVAKGVAYPRDKASSRATTQRPNLVNYSLKRIAKSLYKIRHWNIQLGSHSDLENVEATYFIDPPYQVGGDEYVHNKIDYVELAAWCKSRDGQVIVCENTKADWLPFLPMKKQRGSRHTTTE